MRIAIPVLLAFALSACAEPADDVPVDEPQSALQTETGTATYYADILDRRRTASGELLDQTDMVAAHRAFPFGTRLRVTNTRNDRSVEVRVIDRGPFGSSPHGRAIIDLSRAAARSLDFEVEGRVPVRVELLEMGEGLQAEP